MSDPERGFLGLTHNPFTSPGDDFFERGDRKTYLEQLRHLSRWSRRLLLVTGLFGVGKTVLYRRLSASMEPSAKAARINGTLVSSPREVLANVAQGFAVAVPADANTQLLTDLIIAHVDEQAEVDRFCVTLVDDAHLLDYKSVDALLVLMGRCELRIILFGEQNVATVVDKSAERHFVEWHEMRLSGFADEDIREYLEWRFRQAKYRGRLPFTDQQVADLARLSEGLPGRINKIANDVLIQLESGIERRPERFPGLHRSLIALLIVVSGLVYVVWQTSQGQPAPVEVAEAHEVAPEAVPEEIPGVESLTVPTIYPVVEQLVPEIVEAPELPVEEPEVSTAPDRRDGAWLMSQPPSAYTIQLVTVSSGERALTYIIEQHDPSEFGSYRLQRNGRILHVVVYGLFDTRTQAEAAARSLPDGVGNVQPWVRPMDQVHGAIRTTLQ
ncbi:MAG: AAA family ATPase [Gammaproteobacteria bacterium]|nr:AAA family ATPase [Gammaproteobacteria bacterium]